MACVTDTDIVLTLVAPQTFSIGAKHDLPEGFARRTSENLYIMLL